MSKERISLGKHGEELASEFLESAGLRIIVRNYRNKTGEIDIIARDQETLVFVEVKTRKSLTYGQPYEAVSRKKQKQICRLALYYMTRNKLHDQAVRFDVISIVMTSNENPKIEHLINCFEADSSFY